MATKKSDMFANFAAIRVLESAANTQTSAKFAFPFSIMDKMALVISRIEYWLGSLSQLNSSGDFIYGALTTAASVVGISDQTNPLIVDSMAWLRNDFGTAANGMIYQTPIVKDFSNLMGGGLLVAPNPLYAMVEGSGEASASALYIKLFYTYMELGTDEYWQLVESRRVISS